MSIILIKRPWQLAVQDIDHVAPILLSAPFEAP
jgi:hypothetical protein